MTVHVLVSCRRPELERASTLVFSSLRVGFPTANVVVHANRPWPDHNHIDEAIGQVRPVEVVEVNTIHHRWIEDLVNNSLYPFWICDTDQVFWQPVEHWSFPTPIAGRYIPQWKNPYAGAVELPRLHTSLMWIDPARVRLAVEKWKAQFPDDCWTPKVSLYKPAIIPMRQGINLFADCTAMLFAAIGGARFTPDQMDSYTHLNFGTIEDQVLSRMPDADKLVKGREAFWRNPARFRGDWRNQDAYYAAHRA